MTDPAPVFASVNMVVADMDASVAFYRRLGIDIPDRGPWDGDHRTAETANGLELELDHTTFAPRWNSGWPGSKGRGGAVFGFSVATQRFRQPLEQGGVGSSQREAASELL